MCDNKFSSGYFFLVKRNWKMEVTAVEDSQHLSFCGHAQSVDLEEVIVFDL